MANEAFPPEVVAQIMNHMNVDHAGDSVLICRALGGQPGASEAQMTGMDSDGIDFSAVVDGTELPVRIAWSQRLTARPQVREEVVRMYQQACAVLGVTPRSAD